MSWNSSAPNSSRHGRGVASTTSVLDAASAVCAHLPPSALPQGVTMEWSIPNSSANGACNSAGFQAVCLAVEARGSVVGHPVRVLSHRRNTTRTKGMAAMKEYVKLTAALMLLGIVFASRVTAQSGCTAADSSANHHDGTFVGNPPPECVEGISGAALLFDGAQNFVNVPNDAALYPQTSFTLETWFKTTARGGPMLGCLSSTAGYELAINSDFGFPVFQGRFQNTAYFGTAGPGNVVDGNWHHLAATWDSDTRVLRVFTDGVLGETKTTAGPLIVGTLALTFGKSGTAFPLGPITVDEVRLSDIVRYPSNFTPQHAYTVDSHTIAYWSLGACDSDTTPPTIVCPGNI